MQFENEPNDRRGADRFPLAKDFLFEVLSKRGHRGSGAGITVDMSSKGILFTTNSELLLGEQLEISMRWSDAANLVAHGTVVRVHGNSVAVETQHCEFRASE